jgi:hypothetical protein
LGDSGKDFHGGPNAWISVFDIGSHVISFVFIFSAMGFEEFMRTESIREGEKNVPLSKAEDVEIPWKRADAAICQEQSIHSLR